MENLSYAEKIKQQTPEYMFKRYFTKKNIEVDWVNDFNEHVNEVYEDNPNKSIYEHCKRIGSKHLTYFVDQVEHYMALPAGYKLSAIYIMTDLEHLLAEMSDEVYKVDVNSAETPEVVKKATAQCLAGFKLAKQYIKSHNIATNVNNGNEI